MSDPDDRAEERIAPTLTTLTPSSIDISLGDVQTVTVDGTDFDVDSVVVADGNNVATGTYVSATEMTFDANTLMIPDAGTIQIEVKNGIEISNALPLTMTGTPAIGNPNFIPDTPMTGASPNTPAERAEYNPPEPPDVYQQATPSRTYARWLRSITSASTRPDSATSWFAKAAARRSRRDRAMRNGARLTAKGTRAFQGESDGPI
jgi:hypothetical protein